MRGVSYHMIAYVTWYLISYSVPGTHESNEVHSLIVLISYEVHAVRVSYFRIMKWSWYILLHGMWIVNTGRALNHKKKKLSLSLRFPQVFHTTREKKIGHHHGKLGLRRDEESHVVYVRYPDTYICVMYFEMYYSSSISMDEIIFARQNHTEYSTYILIVLYMRETVSCPKMCHDSDCVYVWHVVIIIWYFLCVVVLLLTPARSAPLVTC